jgi:hypothetical protein
LSDLRSPEKDRIQLVRAHHVDGSGVGGGYAGDG